MLVNLTPDEAWAVAEVLGRVTVRQLRAMGLTPEERSLVLHAHARLVDALQASRPAEPDPRQLVLRLHDAQRASHELAEALREYVGAALAGGALLGVPSVCLRLLELGSSDLDLAEALDVSEASGFALALELAPLLSRYRAARAAEQRLAGP